MKILDRYVITQFIKNYVLSFLILVGLYVVLDMLFNFDDLLAVQEKAGMTGAQEVLGLVHTILDYYFYQILLIFVQLSGVIPVVAAAFTLMRMSRFNELSAMLSAGVPLLRVAMPIIIVAVAVNALLLVDEEFVISLVIPKLMRQHNEAGMEGSKVFPIKYLLDDKNAVLMCSLYDPNGTPSMYYLSVIERDAQRQATGLLTAHKAVWDPHHGQWNLEQPTYVTGLGALQKRIIHLPAPSSYKSKITPEEIMLNQSRQYVELLSTRRIKELLKPENSANFSSAELLKVMHARFTQPFINVILLLLAIPCVLTREPGRLKAAASWCVTLVGICMATVFISRMVAGQPPPDPDWVERWPALMAWLPIFIFGPIAVILLDRVKT